MRFTKRDIDMLEYLRAYENITLDAMSDAMEVSTKTLKNQLMGFGELLRQFGMDIQLVNGSQIVISGREKFADVMSMTIPHFEMDFERRLLLLLTLHDDFLIIQDIADALLVSKSYAEKHLAAVMKKYPEDIQSQRHYGIRYAGSQNKRRQLFVKILFPYLFGEDYRVAIHQFDSLHFPLLAYFTEGELKKAGQALELLKGLRWFRFTDESLQQIYLYVLFLVRHADSGNTEEPVCDDSAFLEQEEFSGLYDWIRSFCESLSLPKSEAEIRCLYRLLLSLRKQRIVCQDQVSEKMLHPVRQILEEIHQRLSVDLRQDAELIEGLSAHIYTTILRGNRIDLEADVYMLKSMKRQYPFGFEMAAIASSYIYDIYDLLLSETEIMYLAIHFQAAIERLRDAGEKTRIAIVCHFGAAAARIIRSKIERKLSNVEITGMYSLQEFSELAEPNCDCIVTTERISQADCPVIFISMTLSEREMYKIKEGIREVRINHLLELCVLEALILPIDAPDRESAIEAMIAPLAEEEFVTKEYLQSVLDREKTFSTNLTHIALPHGNPSLVLNTRLVIGRMRKPLLWDDSQVYCAFLFAVSPEVLREKPMLFNTFYRAFANPEVEDAIKKLQMQSNLPDEVFRQKLFHILK